MHACMHVSAVPTEAKASGPAGATISGSWDLCNGCAGSQTRASRCFKPLSHLCSSICFLLLMAIKGNCVVGYTGTHLYASTWEAQTGNLKFEANLGFKVRPYLQNQK